MRHVLNFLKEGKNNLMKKKPLAFVKMGSKKNMEKLLQKGEIYLNPIEYFLAYPDEGVRKDQNENLEMLYQAENIKLEMNIMGKDIVLSSETGLIDQFKASDNSHNKTKIYSMLTISNGDEREATLFDEKNLSFGDHFVFIKEPRIFLDRVFSEINQKGYGAKFDYVEYVDSKSHNGEMGIFRKLNEYSYQKESRIHVLDTSESPLILEIGSIEDIAFSGDINLLKGIKLNKL